MVAGGILIALIMFAWFEGMAVKKKKEHKSGTTTRCGGRTYSISTNFKIFKVFPVLYLSTSEAPTSQTSRSYSPSQAAKESTRRVRMLEVDKGVSGCR